MNVIKTNYNNAFIKKPTVPVPSFNVYRHFKVNDDESVTKTLIINIIDHLEDEPFFTDYKLFIYVDDELVGTCTKRSNNTITITNANTLARKNAKVYISGYYFNDNGYQQEFPAIEARIFMGVICSNYTICSHTIRVSHTHSAYYNPEDKMMYQEYTDGVFSNPVEFVPDRLYWDLISDYLYKWNSEQECYIVI